MRTWREVSAGSNVGAVAKAEMDEVVECKQNFRHVALSGCIFPLL